MTEEEILDVAMGEMALHAEKIESLTVTVPKQVLREIIRNAMRKARREALRSD